MDTKCAPVLRPTALWEGHKNLVYSRAHSWARTTRHEPEELIAEGHIAFMEALSSYDGSSKFSTWVYGACNLRMRAFAQRNAPPVAAPEEMPEAMELERKEFDHSWLHSLSEEARFIAELLISSPREALGILGSEPPKAIRGKLRDHLRAQGWSWARIWGAFAELKQKIREL